jgi:hypothetical protein
MSTLTPGIGTPSLAEVTTPVTLVCACASVDKQVKAMHKISKDFLIMI